MNRWPKYNNDYTDEEKEKLSKLENYDDTQVKSDINTIKNIDKRTAMINKTRIIIKQPVTQWISKYQSHRNTYRQQKNQFQPFPVLQNMPGISY